MWTLAIVTLLLSSLIFNTDAACSAEQYACDDGQCILRVYRCDNSLDCTDTSDENNCTYQGSCNEGELRCYNGECINPNFECDRKNDCVDGSDELECDYKSTLSTFTNGLEEIVTTILNLPQKNSLSTVRQDTSRLHTISTTHSQTQTEQNVLSTGISTSEPHPSTDHDETTQHQQTTTQLEITFSKQQDRTTEPETTIKNKEEKTIYMTTKTPESSEDILTTRLRTPNTNENVSLITTTLNLFEIKETETTTEHGITNKQTQPRTITMQHQLQTTSYRTNTMEGTTHKQDTTSSHLTSTQVMTTHLNITEETTTKEATTPSKLLTTTKDKTTEQYELSSQQESIATQAETTTEFYSTLREDTTSIKQTEKLSYSSKISTSTKPEKSSEQVVITTQETPINQKTETQTLFRSMTSPMTTVIENRITDVDITTKKVPSSLQLTTSNRATTTGPGLTINQKSERQTEETTYQITYNEVITTQSDSNTTTKVESTSLPGDLPDESNERDKRFLPVFISVAVIVLSTAVAVSIFICRECIL